MTFMFTREGELEGATGPLRIYAPGNLTITEVFIAVNTAPTGGPIVVDVNKNGTTIFTDQGKRPSIAATENTDTSDAPDVTALAKNDYLTMDIDLVGTTTPGEDLTVHVRCTGA